MIYLMNKSIDKRLIVDQVYFSFFDFCIILRNQAALAERLVLVG